jgi:Flp pilus assembly protein TadG
MKHISRLANLAARLDRGSQAQALVEFALVLPLLLLLLVGIIDFGRALFVYSEVSNAAREAVRYAAVAPTIAMDYQSRAQCFLIHPRSVFPFSSKRNTSGGFSTKGVRTAEL